MTKWRRVLHGVVWRYRARLSRGRIKIGPGLVLEGRLQIRGPGTVTIGRAVLVAGLPGERRSLVTIHTHAPEASVSIGDGTRLLGARIGSKFEIRIGSGVLIEDASLADTDFHSVSPQRGVPENESLVSCRVVIGDRVAIGARSIITKGVELGSEVTVLPGSVVVRSAPPGSVVAGNPARLWVAPKR